MPSQRTDLPFTEYILNNLLQNNNFNLSILFLSAYLIVRDSLPARGKTNAFNINAFTIWHFVLIIIYTLAGIPVEGKSSECLICMKYRIILIIIIISLGQIFYRILQTHHACTHARVHTRTRAHACTRTHTHAHTAVITVRHTCYRYSVSPNRDGPLRLRQCRTLSIQITTCTGDPITRIFWMFFAYKNIARPN